jgi:hypothetical protein
MIYIWLTGLFLAMLSASWFALEGGMTVLAATSPLASTLRRGRGRPRKFAAPSRAVTLTLPEEIIESLSRIHNDLSQAVVGLACRRRSRPAREAAELLVFGKRAVITIRPTPSLEPRTGVNLVPLPDGRALIAFDTPMSVADLELMLADALEDKSLTADDRRVYEGLSLILKDARRSKDVSLLRQHIIVLESAHGKGSDAKPIRRERGRSG